MPVPISVPLWLQRDARRRARARPWRSRLRASAEAPLHAARSRRRSICRDAPPRRSALRAARPVHSGCARAFCSISRRAARRPGTAPWVFFMPGLQHVAQAELDRIEAELRRRSRPSSSRSPPWSPARRSRAPSRSRGRARRWRSPPRRSWENSRSTAAEVAPTMVSGDGAIRPPAAIGHDAGLERLQQAGPPIDADPCSAC